MRTLFCAALSAVSLGAAGDVIFDNTNARWVIDGDGCVTKIIERKTARNLVGEKVPFVTYVGTDGVTNAPVACTGDRKRLDFRFANGSKMSLKVSEFPGGWTFETADCALKDADALWFVRLKPACAKYFGAMANAISDDASAVFVRGYRPETEMTCSKETGDGVLAAGALRKSGFDGHRAGLAAAPRGDILKTVREMTKAAGVPWSKAGGAWAQDSALNRGSYFFATGMDLPSLDDWIDMAERGGFDLFHFHVWWKLYGSYEVDLQSFPNGTDDLKAAAARVRDAGFRVGTHTLSACIEWGSKWLMPVCDTNLIDNCVYTLARPFRPGDTELYVEEPFWKDQATVFVGSMGVYKSKGNTFRIGNELVQYWSADRDARKFTGIRRGVFRAFGDKTYPVTVGGTYPAGTKVHYLRSCYASFYPVPDSPLMDKVIARIDDVFNSCGMEEIYFDGSEGMGERYAVDRMRERIFDSLKQGPDGIVNEASCRNPFHWWFRSRLWPWDHNWYGPKPLQDLHLRTTLKQSVKADFLATNTGWWAPLEAGETHRGHFLDDMEYFMCKNAAHDVSTSIQGAYVTDGPLSFGLESQMTLMGWWERIRMAKAFAKGLQEGMKPEGAEFRLRQDNRGDWTVTPVSAAVQRVAWDGDRAWKVPSAKACKAELRVEALYGLKPYDDADAKPLLAAESKFEVTAAKGVTTEVRAGTDAQHGATIVLSAANAGATSRGAWTLASEHHPYPDLVKTDGAFGCWVKGDGSGATLAFRLKLHRFNWGGVSDHYVKLDFTGWRYVSFLLRERDADAFAKMEWDITANWRKNRDVFNAPFWAKEPSVEWVCVGLNEIPAGGRTTVEIGEVRQMPVTKPSLEGAAVVVNGQELKLPFVLAAGDYAELTDGTWVLYDEKGNPKRRVAGEVPFDLVAGENAFSFKAADPRARAQVTVFAKDKAMSALGTVPDANRRWLDYEAVMPVLYAPSRGFDAEVDVAPRPRERARLTVEIWGPVDTPSVTLDKRTWTFPVRLGTNEHIVCRNGVDWTAERVVPGKTREQSGEWYKIAPSARVRLAEGRLAEPLPTISGPVSLVLGAKDPKTCAARVEFVKRYVKPFRLWTLEEIRAGVTEKGDDVGIAYPAEGYDLGKVKTGGGGRTDATRVFVVPAAIYDTAKVVVRVDADAKKDRVFTVRLTRYNDGPPLGGRDFAGMMNIPVDFDTAEKRDLGGGLWEVTVPLDMGNIADLVWGGDLFGTWLNNTIRPGARPVRPELGNYLDFEILPRLVRLRDPMGDGRKTPDKRFNNALTVCGATLHKAGVSFEIIESQTGNVFAADEKPETSVKVNATAPGKWTLAWTIRDVEGNVLKKETHPLSTSTSTFTLDLAQPRVGWYALDYTLEHDGKTVLTHKASFALLPPDTRKEGIGEGPYGSWSYGGAHYNLRKIDEYGPLFLKAGFRRCLGVDGKEGHKYKISPQAVTWNKYKKMTREERIADLRRQLEENPNVTTFLMFHEDSPWTYQHAWEITGQPVPDPHDWGVAGWYSPSGAKDRKAGFAARAERFARAMEQCKLIRENFPQIRISLGNSGANTETIAEVVRQGFPEAYADYMGIESKMRNQLPEREGDMCFQVADMMMQLAEHFGCEKWRPNATWEAGYRTDSLIGLDKQAAWQVRDVLLEQAWRFPDIFVGIITDCGNGYGGSFWGGAGLCYRAPMAYPKPVYVGIATVTRLLDQVVSVRRIPCGDPCVYVTEYTRKDGTCVTALWTSRGTAQLDLSLAKDRRVEYVDFYGRPSAPLRKAGEFAAYVVSDGPAVLSAKVGARTFPGWDREPSDAKLVARTDSAADWRLEGKTNATIEITTGPFLPYRTLGQYEVREVVDEERGKCLELELVKPNMALPKIMNEYAVLELRKPVLLEGDPKTIGAWVKGNSGWGQFYWVLEDAKGNRYYSCGQGAHADVFDYDGTVSLCYTGWNFLRMPVKEGSSVRNLSTGGVGIIWRGGSFSGPMKLAGVAFAAMNRPLFLTERHPHNQKIRIGGIFASDFSK